MWRRSIRGRVVVVAGASSGIGRTTVRRLAADGALVVACARDTVRLEEAVRGLVGVTAVGCDVRHVDERQHLVDQAMAEHGRIDALVNNAGVGWLGLVEEMPLAAVEDLVQTNLVAVIDLSRRVLPAMLSRRDGDIVMLSSIAAWSSMPPLTVYCATKFGVDGLVKGLRRELTMRGVRVHSVNPGPVRTEWLARSAGCRPGRDVDLARHAQGVPAELVAYHVRRCLTSRWPRTAAVPRVLGLTRLGEVPPLNRLLDVTMSPLAPELRRSGASPHSRKRAEPARRQDDQPAGASGM